MKAVAALVGALMCVASVQLSTNVELEAFVWYDGKFATNVGRDDFGPFIKRLFNAFNSRLFAEYGDLPVRLVLVGLEEIPGPLSSVIGSVDRRGRFFPYGTAVNIREYFQGNTSTGNASLADIVMYLSGEYISDFFPEDNKYYRSYAPNGTICTQNKGLATAFYNRDFSQVTDMMHSLERLLGSKTPYGVRKHLPKQLQKHKDCPTRHLEELYPDVTDLPGENLDGHQYCRNYSDKRSDFSLCEKLEDGCLFSCCWNNEKRENRRTQAPDGYACGGQGKICINDECVTGEAKDFKPPPPSKPKKNKKKPKKNKDKKSRESSKSSG